MDSSNPRREVVLGLGAPDGYSGADVTSPARAARAGGMVDTAIGGPVTELRIHGVSGSSPASMLEHPTSLQVGGDGTSGFHRRWTPAATARAAGLSVPWRLEAYSWGGLTQARLASASWILLAPFMLYNVAHYMLPVRRSGPGRHTVAAAVLRLLALGATLQMVAATAGALLDVVALQGHDGLPDWLASWSAPARATAALALVTLVIGMLWLISVRTGNSYEARTVATKDPAGAPVPDWPLRDPAFWRGKELVDRQRTVHTAAAMATVAGFAALPGWSRPLPTICAVAAGLLLAITVGLTASPAVHRRSVVHEAGRARTLSPLATRSRRLAVLTIAAVLLLASVVGAAASGTWDAPAAAGVHVAFTWFWTALTAVQLALLVVMALLVTALLGSAADRRADRPYLGGQAAPVVALLAVLLGGLLSAVVTIAIARSIGMPVPDGSGQPADISVPPLLYAFAATPWGFLVGALAAGLWLVRRFLRNRGEHKAAVAHEYGLTPDEGTERNRGRIATAWAVGDLADDAGPVIATVTAGGVLAMCVAALSPLSMGVVGQSWVQGFVAASTVAAVVVAGWLVGLLRSAYADGNRRRVIGAVWDVGTFWPRAAHPFAPPCYAERAVPEVVDRIRILTGCVGTGAETATVIADAALAGDPADRQCLPTGPVLLTGYSQGSVIAAAVAAQLPERARALIALLTLACPARRLYGRAFPAYFGPDRIEELAALPAGGASLRWKNVARRSDYIGSWVRHRPADPAASGCDCRSLDPVAVVADRHPAPPPIHRHSDWWADRWAGAVAAGLVAELAGVEQTGDGSAPAQAPLTAAAAPPA